MYDDFAVYMHSHRFYDGRHFSKLHRHCSSSSRKRRDNFFKTQICRGEDAIIRKWVPHSSSSRRRGRVKCKKGLSKLCNIASIYIWCSCMTHSFSSGPCCSCVLISSHSILISTAQPSTLNEVLLKLVGKLSPICVQCKSIIWTFFIKKQMCACYSTNGKNMQTFCDVTILASE